MHGGDTPDVREPALQLARALLPAKESGPAAGKRISAHCMCVITKRVHTVVCANTVHVVHAAASGRAELMY